MQASHLPGGFTQGEGGVAPGERTCLACYSPGSGGCPGKGGEVAGALVVARHRRHGHRCRSQRDRANRYRACPGLSGNVGREQTRIDRGSGSGADAWIFFPEPCASGLSTIWCSSEASAVGAHSCTGTGLTSAR